MQDKNLDYSLNKTIGLVLRQKREKMGLSLDNVCSKLNNEITKQALANYELGTARLKNMMFQKICLALNESPEDVWEEIYMKYYKNEVFKEERKK